MAGQSASVEEDEDDGLTIRVSNIDEEATEDDLRDLFQRYGPFQRVYLATAKADNTIVFTLHAPPGNVGLTHVSGKMYLANQKGMRYLRDEKGHQHVKDMHIPADVHGKPRGVFRFAAHPRRDGPGPKTGHHDKDEIRWYTTARKTGAFIQKGSGGDMKSENQAYQYRLFNSNGIKQGVFNSEGRDNVTKVSRGFAYIKFYAKEKAAKAIAELNGHGYGHLILKVERAKPSTRDGVMRTNTMKYASGYGRALPQEGSTVNKPI